MTDHEIKVVCPACGTPTRVDERTAEVAGIVCPSCRRRTDDPGEPQHGLPRVGIASDEEAILTSLSPDGGLALDIGTGLGISAWALARRSHAVVTVDPDPWVHQVIWPELPGNVRTYPALVDVPKQVFGVAFIDGVHTAEAVRNDFIFAVRRTYAGGLVLVHDWRHVPDVIAPTVRHLVGMSAPVIEFHTTWGIGMVYVTPELAARMWEVAR